MAKKSKAAEVEEVKTRLRTRKVAKTVDGKLLLSSGSTLVNLAATGKTNGCFMKSGYHFFVGDSGSGKTWLCLSALAEATLSKRFDKYRLIYDASENGALMDMEKYFGKALVERLEPPGRDGEGNPVYSETAEDMYDFIGDAFEDGRPFIYIEDSMDMLETRDNLKKQVAQKKARRNPRGVEVPGSYGDGKAKINSTHLRGVVARLPRTGSILIIIAQTRDKIGTMMTRGSNKTRAGGHALTFYATSELWTSKGEGLYKEVRGKRRKIGTQMIVKIKKNRTSGRDRTVTVPIYYSHGVDDIGSCVDYLVEESHWKKVPKKGIKCPEWDVVMRRDDLIEHIEAEGLEDELRAIVGEVWNDIDAQCALNRKSRYGKQDDEEAD